MMKKAAIFVVSGLILMVAFAFLIYPTPYHYLQFSSNNSTMPIKINSLTGETKLYAPAMGWVDSEEYLNKINQ